MIPRLTQLLAGVALAFGALAAHAASVTIACGSVDLSRYTKGAEKEHFQRNVANNSPA